MPSARLCIRRPDPRNHDRALTLAALSLSALTIGACASDDAAQQPGSEIAAAAEEKVEPFLPEASQPAINPVPHAFTALDMVSMERVGGPVLSPDGKTLVFGRRTLVLDDNSSRGTLWSMPAEGGAAKQLTFHPKGAGSQSFSPDGKWLYFLSSRSGSSQLWRLPLEGGEPGQVTDLPLSLTGYHLSKDGNTVLFSAEVFTNCESLTCTKERLEARAETKESGQVYDRIFVRHWDTWKDGRRSQLFTVPVAGGDVVRVTQGLDADVPPKPWWGSEAFAFAPDGKGVIFVAKDAALGLEPVSTNYDLFSSPLDGSAPPRRLTENLAWDDHPVFSPDGKMLAYVAMERAGFEADRLRIMLKDQGSSAVPRALTQDWDRSVAEMIWSEDGQALIVTTYDVGQRSVFKIDVASGEVKKILEGGHHTAIAVSQGRLFFRRNDFATPDELFSANIDGSDVRALTSLNAARLKTAERGTYEQFSFKGAGGDDVYGWMVRPAGFTDDDIAAGKKVPLAFLIHGGPQGSFSNRFHYRWNPQTYAGAGFAVITIDFHGSVGYGQDFTDAITGDWGGKPLEDLQKGLAAALEKYPFIDGDNACALGASYGGYMVNWIAGAWPERFKCLVNHDGIFDQRSMYWATEELWFPEWEHGGPYYESQDKHELHNPMSLVTKWKTPMLVVHGALDHRVPLEQGLQTFNALQRRGIESRLLYYPDENHWVLQPKNSLQWHREVERWMKDHTAK